MCVSVCVCVCVWGGGVSRWMPVGGRQWVGVNRRVSVGESEQVGVSWRGVSWWRSSVRLAVSAMT